MWPFKNREEREAERNRRWEELRRIARDPERLAQWMLKMEERLKETDQVATMGLFT